MNGPDIICPGTYKCGTTWFFAMVEQHPEIFVPDFKEFHYFSTIHGGGLWENKSIDWYYNHFPDNEQVSLDISPGYLIEPKAADRIAKHVPEARFVCVFRDPVKRAHAHYYYQQLGKYDLGCTFDELIDDPSIDHEGRWNVLGHGFYARNLEPFLKLFERDRFNFLFLEDIKEKPKEVLEDFFSFAGVDSAFLPNGMREKVNPARGLKSKKMYWLKYNIAKFMERSGLSTIRKVIKKTGLPGLISNLNSDTIEKPKFKNWQKEKLLNIYRDDTAALAEIVDRDLSKIWITA